jgi:phosphonate transport system substrate-binding protein
VNEQVWTSRTNDGSVDPAVVKYARTPAFHDYHWLLGPQASERLGGDLADRVRDYFTGLSPDGDADVLDLFGAGSFLPTEASNYAQIEEIGRQLGLVS